jgi:hypothetical protein
MDFRQMPIDWEQYAEKSEAPAPQVQGGAPDQENIDWEQFAAPSKKLDPSIMNRIPGALGHVATDVGNAALSLPGKAIRGAMSLPSNIIKGIKGVPGVYQQITTEPDRAARNVFAGLSDIGHKELNAPRSVADYLAKIGMIEPETAQKVPMQGDISSQQAQFVGEGEHPGDVGIRGTVAHIPDIAMGSKVASVLNPEKLSYKNLAKGVLQSEKEMKEKYSGPNGHYTNLFAEANRRGVSQAGINPQSIDIKTLKKWTPEKYTESTENLLSNPSLENAQMAVSDLGYLERSLDRKVTLTSPERQQLKAVRDAKKHISENMFKDANGNVHPDLVQRHKEVQKGYATEVIPYSKHNAIKAFKRNELSPKELIQRLSKGKFAAQRGSSHKAIGARNTLNSMAGSKLGTGALLTTGGAGAYGILKALMGGND